MKRFLLALLMVPMIAFAAYDAAYLRIDSIISNDVKSVTNSTPLSGKLLSLMIYASTNCTGYVNTVSGYGLSQYQSRTCFGPYEVSANPVWTNFPTPYYLFGDKFHMNFRGVNTNNTWTNTATAVLIFEK
jgi:hypothetical protein